MNPARELLLIAVIGITADAKVPPVSAIQVGAHRRIQGGRAMRTTILVLAIGLASGTTIAGAFAQEKTLNECQTYTNASKDSPDGIRELFAKFTDSIIRVCHTSSAAGLKRYDILSGPWKGALGACYDRSTELFRIIDAKGKAIWSYRSDQGLENNGERQPSSSAQSVLFMTVATGTCPIAGSGRYVAVDQISEGVFLRIMTSWEEALRSNEEFDRAFSLIPQSERNSAAFENFRRTILSRKEGSFPAVNSIAYQGPLPDYGPTVPVVHWSACYLMRFQNPLDSAQSYELAVDITSKGLRIFDFKVAVK